MDHEEEIPETIVTSQLIKDLDREVRLMEVSWPLYRFLSVYIFSICCLRFHTFHQDFFHQNIEKTGNLLGMTRSPMTSTSSPVKMSLLAKGPKKKGVKSKDFGKKGGRWGKDGQDDDSELVDIQNQRKVFVHKKEMVGLSSCYSIILTKCYPPLSLL